MARPPRWRAMLEASVAEACLAVRLYNDPAEARSFEGFVVHMHMAWLYLLHAEFTRDGIDFRHRDPQRPTRLLRIDGGEIKTWELKLCVAQRWPNDNAVRQNLDFFIRLRNKFEHRHASADATLAVAVAGYAHAHLVNFEEELTQAFGANWSLATRLRFPVFIGTFTEEGDEALRRLQHSIPKELRTFIADYRAGLSPEIANDSRFEFRLRVALELAPRVGPDTTAIQFTRLDDMTPELRAAVEEMGRAGKVIVRDQVRPVAGHGLLKPAQVVSAVQASVPSFHMGHFIKAWKHEKVRPAGGSPNPEHTIEKYCLYDSLNENYGYTPAYVQHLIKRCTTRPEFGQIIGLPGP